MPIETLSMLFATVLGVSLGTERLVTIVTVAGANALAIPVPLLGLLATGGSAFWTSAISYVSHVKDIAAEQRTAHRLDNRAKAKKEGVKYDG